MTTAANKPSLIIRTDRGLTLKNSRITLYDLMDYVKAQYPPHLIQGLFNLTDEEIETALAYIEENRATVEAEHQQILSEAEVLREYYHGQNGDRFAEILAQSPRPGTEKAWEKLRLNKQARNSGG